MRTLKKQVTCLVFCALLFGMIPNVQVSSAKKASLNTKKLVIVKDKSKTLKVKNTKKKVVWKILSGKKYINLKGKGKAATIKGRKKGTAKVQAKTGKISLTCTISVINKKNEENKNKPETPATPVSVVKNEQEMAALNALIKEHRERGATISENLDCEEYRWEDGRLTYINWNTKNLSGTLNVSAFVNLKYLNFDDNEVYRLDVGRNVNLTELHCVYNQLNNLDLSNNVNLEKLYCDENELSSLNVSNNVKLTEIHCTYNQLSSLDLSNNANLRTLSCYVNQLSTLDISCNFHLISLSCQWNQMSSIIGISACEKLEYLYCDKNQIESLNLSNNKKLKRLHCDSEVELIYRGPNGEFIYIKK